MGPLVFVREDHREHEAEGARGPDAYFFTVIEIFVETVLVGHKFAPHLTLYLPAMTQEIKKISPVVDESVLRRSRPCRRGRESGMANCGNSRLA